MTNPQEQIISDEREALWERMKAQVVEWENEEPRSDWWQWQRDFEAAISTPPAQAEASTLPGEVVENKRCGTCHGHGAYRDGWCEVCSGRGFVPATPPATPAVESGEDDRGFETEVTFEVWEDDMLVASSTDEADARHYLAVYSQDGPVKLVKAVTTRAAMNGETT